MNVCLCVSSSYFKDIVFKIGVIFLLTLIKIMILFPYCSLCSKRRELFTENLFSIKS